MKKAVWVKVIGTQINDLGEADKIELMTEGKLFMKNNSYYIVYTESEVSGMEGTTTSVRVEEDKVVLNRMGASEHKQTFKAGIPDVGSYVTPFGTMMMKVLPSKVDVNLNSLGGSVDLEYELVIGEEKVSDNKLSILVEEVNI